MKKFYATLEAKSKDADITEIKVYGKTSNAAKRSDVTAWLHRSHPDHTVKSIRLTSKEVTE